MLELNKARDDDRDRRARPVASRVLNIFEPIVGGDMRGPGTADEYIQILTHWERRDGDAGLPITININSPGGSVMDGLALYDTIQRLRRKGHFVTTRAQGLVASMATIILQAGDERIADENVQILVHELSGGAGGKISGIRDEAAMMERLNARLFSILADRSTLTARSIKSRADRKEWWMDAAEALKLGFVDRVE